MPSKGSTKTPKKAEKNKQDKKGAMSGEPEVINSYTYEIYSNICVLLRQYRISWNFESCVC